jgi:hypothetical protein
MTVRSPKTEHHPGGESRVIPLFPEHRPHLEQCFDEAEPGEEFVIRRYRRRNSNPRTQLMKIIRRAGLKPWPKLFQNLRSTRETELADQFPIQVVCDWTENTEAIASKHYLQVTEDHFAKVVQNPVQQPAVLPRTGSQVGLATEENTQASIPKRTPARAIRVEFRIRFTSPFQQVLMVGLWRLCNSTHEPPVPTHRIVFASR